VLRRY